MAHRADSDILLHLLASGVYHDDGTHDRLWLRTFERLVACATSRLGRYNEYLTPTARRPVDARPEWFRPLLPGPLADRPRRGPSPGRTRRASPVWLSWRTGPEHL